MNKTLGTVLGLLAVTGIFSGLTWLLDRPQLPGLIVNPESTFIDFYPQYADGIVQAALATEHITTSASAQKVVVTSTFQHLAWEGTIPGYIADGEPNALLMVMRIGDYEARAYVVPRDFDYDLDGPMNYKLVFFGKAARACVRRLAMMSKNTHAPWITN